MSDTRDTQSIMDYVQREFSRSLRRLSTEPDPSPAHKARRLKKEQKWRDELAERTAQNMRENVSPQWDVECTVDENNPEGVNVTLTTRLEYITLTLEI